MQIQPCVLIYTEVILWFQNYALLRAFCHIAVVYNAGWTVAAVSDDIWYITSDADYYVLLTGTNVMWMHITF